MMSEFERYFFSSPLPLFFSNTAASSLLDNNDPIDSDDIDRGFQAIAYEPHFMWGQVQPWLNEFLGTLNALPPFLTLPQNQAANMIKDISDQRMKIVIADAKRITQWIDSIGELEETFSTFYYIILGLLETKEGIIINDQFQDRLYHAVARIKDIGDRTSLLKASASLLQNRSILQAADLCKLVINIWWNAFVSTKDSICTEILDLIGNDDDSKKDGIFDDCSDEVPDFTEAYDVNEMKNSLVRISDSVYEAIGKYDNFVMSILRPVLSKVIGNFLVQRFLHSWHAINSDPAFPTRSIRMEQRPFQFNLEARSIVFCHIPGYPCHDRPEYVQDDFVSLSIFNFHMFAHHMTEHHAGEIATQITEIFVSKWGFKKEYLESLIPLEDLTQIVRAECRDTIRMMHYYMHSLLPAWFESVQLNRILADNVSKNMNGFRIGKPSLLDGYSLVHNRGDLIRFYLAIYFLWIQKTIE